MKSFFQKSDKSLFLLLLILIFGFWFRIQGFLYGTYAFTYDVGRDMLALQQIVITHKLPLIGATTGLHGVFYGPTWYYLLSPFYVISFGNPSGIVMLMAISGILTVIVGFFVGKYVGGNRLGLIFSLLLSLSQVLTQISAQIWNPNLIPLFLIALFYVILFKIRTDSKSKMWFLLCGILLGIIFDLEIVFGMLFVISTAIYLILTKAFIKNTINIPIFISGFIFIQLPRVFFELRHDFLMTRTFIAAFSSHTTSSLLTPIPNFSRTTSILFTLWNETVAFKILPLGILVGILILLVLIKSYKQITEKEKNILDFSVIILFVYFIGLSFFNHDIESHYYIGLPLIFILLLSLAIYFSGKYIKIQSVGVLLIVIFFTAVVNQLKIIGTFEKGTWIGDASVYRNQLEVIDYIYKDADGQKFNYVTYTPPVYDYPYQYIFQNYVKNKYGYLPNANHEKLFYLIIEPDLQIPDRQRMWLDVRKGDGVVVSDKLFGSGIRVEKRLH